MAINEYYFEDKRYYLIRTSKRGSDNPTDNSRSRKSTRFDERGKRITSKIVAERIEFEFKKEVEQESSGKTIWTWEKWHNEAVRQMKLTLKQGTVKNYDQNITNWLPRDWSIMLVSEITKSDIFNLIFKYIPEQEKSTAHTQHGVLRRIKRILQMALEEGIISRNPADGIKVKVPKPAQKVLNSVEATTLLQEAKNCNHRFYYHWGLALYTGMRNGELYALCWKDIDFPRNIISVTKQWTSKDGLHETKTNKNRIVPISQDLKQLLLELKEMGPFKENLSIGINNMRKDKEAVPVDDLVLPRNRDWRLGNQASVLADFCKAIQITPIKFHDLRATLITNLLSEGVSLAKTMAIAGHNKIGTTNEYLRLAGVDVKKDTMEHLRYRIPTDSSGNVANLFKKNVA